LKISKALGASLLTAALVAGPVCAASATPARAAVQATAASTTLDLFDAGMRQTAIDIFDQTNAFRATKGLKPLKFNANIAAISQRWSTNMAVNSFNHNPDFVSDAPAGWNAASENIAWSTWPPSGKRFVDMWIDSPGHNANMSRPGDEYLGIGISSRDGATYATQNFFGYQDGVVPAGTYNHPRDFFNGLPELPRGRVVLATAPAPTWDIAKRTYTIPSAEGVEYVVGSKYEVNMKKAPGTYAANDGYHTISAVPKAGYQLSNYKTFWEVTFGMLWVTVKGPVFNKTARTVTIPVSTGVQYQLNGNNVAAGVHPFHDVAKVEARATHGYLLSGNLNWSATVPLINVTVKSVPTFDKKAGTYTIPAQAGVQFIINNQPVAAGTYKSLEYVYVSARAANGYTMSGAPEWVLRPGPDSVDAYGPFFADYSTLFLIPDNPGVQYYLNGKAVDAGRYTGAGKVTVTATAKDGFRLAAGSTSWSYDYTPPTVKVAAPAPTFNRTTARYTIPARQGVTYLVSGVVKAAGSYAGSSKVTVSAKAVAGYTLTGTATWSYDLTPQAVAAAAPAFTPATGRYTIPKKTGVSYLVDGKAVPAGTYSSNSRRVAVTAKASPGYKLSGTASWTYDFRKAVTPAKPAMSSSTNRYTIPAKAGVTYSVDGKIVKAGTYRVTNGKTLKFTAKASSSSYRLSGTTAWSFRF
jgi:uncharacterized protein YkwD